MKVPQYVIGLARKNAPHLDVAGMRPNDVTARCWQSAYALVDLGDLALDDRQAYVTACKAILTGLAS
jgi:hypothetical protein